jgi:hypothetical protein
MRLNKGQKEKVLEWVADGLKTDEINRRAAQYEEPFVVTRDQVRFYRNTRDVNLQELSQSAEYDALNSGLALRENRVKKLQQLADKLENDIFGENLWVTDVKAVGAELVYIERFNAAEVSEYRGTIDDIAKEMGGRVQKIDQNTTETIIITRKGKDD